jgi:hypothetical protein
VDEAIQKITVIDGDDGQTTRLAHAIRLFQKSQATNNQTQRDQAMAMLVGLERERLTPQLTDAWH